MRASVLIFCFRYDTERGNGTIVLTRDFSPERGTVPMLPTTVLIALAIHPVLALPTASWQPSLAKRGNEIGIPLKVEKSRAVLLLHGLWIHPLKPGRVLIPEQHDWQKSNAALVKELSAEFDVFGFGYAQTIPLDFVIYSQGLRSKVAELKSAGYKEIVLIGHSAGGVVARQFVERFPDAGVTKVIQVSSPNAGSDLASLSLALPRIQQPFVRSLAPEPRIKCCEQAPPIPKSVQFCSVVCKAGRLSGDTVVSLTSQWPEDLQKQGIPAMLAMSTHNNAMKTPESIKAIVEAAREKLVRWTPDQTEKARKSLFETSFGRGFGLGIIKSKP